jgi:hypothetical protein
MLVILCACVTFSLCPYQNFDVVCVAVYRNGFYVNCDFVNEINAFFATFCMTFLYGMFENKRLNFDVYTYLILFLGLMDVWVHIFFFIFCMNLDFSLISHVQPLVS